MAKKQDNNTDNSIYVVSFQLQTEKWQEHLLEKRFAILNNIYNNLQKKYKRKYHYITQSKSYKEAKENKKLKDFFKNYEEPWIKIKKKERVESTFKPFTEYGILSYASKFLNNNLNSGINSVILQSVATNAWRAWEKFLYGNGKKIKYSESVNSYKIGFVKTNGKIYFIGLDTSQILDKHIIGVNINGKKIFIPFKVNRQSIYENICFQDEIREIGFKRKLIRGQWKYYIFFSFKGKPYNNGRTLGKGDVGIDIGTSTIAVVSQNNVFIDELAKNINLDYKKITELQRKLDRSRRANNQEQYNENGTIKRFLKGERPQWKQSKNYIKLKNKINDLQRKVSEKRKISHSILANNIISFGSNFKVENNPISAWQKRTKETTINKKGRFNSKKRFGKSLGNHAPSAFIEILKNKVIALNGTFEKIDVKNAASQFDFTNQTFTPHKLNVRNIQLSNGNIHLRDTLAAFNIMHCQNVEKSKTQLNYNVEQMFKDYDNFFNLEKQEIRRHQTSNDKLIRSFGIKKY